MSDYICCGQVRYERPAADELPLIDAPVEDLLDFLSPRVLAVTVMVIALERNVSRNDCNDDDTDRFSHLPLYRYCDILVSGSCFSFYG